MNRNRLIALILILFGGLFIYAGLRNKQPLDVIKLALQGKDPGTARPLSDLGGIGGNLGGNLISPLTPTTPPGPQIVPGPQNGLGPI